MLFLLPLRAFQPKRWASRQRDIPHQVLVCEDLSLQFVGLVRLEGTRTVDGVKCEMRCMGERTFERRSRGALEVLGSVGLACECL